MWSGRLCLSYAATELPYLEARHMLEELQRLPQSSHAPVFFFPVLYWAKKVSNLCDREHQVLWELPVLWQYWSICYQDLLQSCIKITVFCLLSSCISTVRGQLGLCSFHSVTFPNCSSRVVLQVSRTSKALVHHQWQSKNILFVIFWVPVEVELHCKRQLF